MILGELAEKRAEAGRLEGAAGRRGGIVVPHQGRTQGDRRAVRRSAPPPRWAAATRWTSSTPTKYIVREDTNVVLTRDGWVKRLGDDQFARRPCGPARATRRWRCWAPARLDAVVFFAADGTAYTLPVDQIPASTGYGEPLGKHVKLDDGVGIVAAVTTDKRFTPEDFEIDGTPDPRPAPVRRHRRRAGLPGRPEQFPRPEHPRRAEISPAARGRPGRARGAGGRGRQRVPRDQEGPRAALQGRLDPRALGGRQRREGDRPGEGDEVLGAKLCPPPRRRAARAERERQGAAVRPDEIHPHRPRRQRRQNEPADRLPPRPSTTARNWRTGGRRNERATARETLRSAAPRRRPRRRPRR